jgi:hypothetical protein
MRTLGSVTENRRDARFHARILARIVRRKETIELLTNDVSFRGVFIRTDAPPALRQLVKIELVLPTSVVVSGHAMVVHVAATDGLPKGECNIPGIGLQFWGPLAHQKEWEQFIHEVRQRERAGAATANATDKVRRASERFKLAIEVTFDGKTSMLRDISENGMAIRTGLAMPVGTHAKLEMRASDQVLTFNVIVRRTIQEPDFRGLGVELVDLDAEKRAALVGFVRANTPSEERIYIEPGDPKLH